MLMDSALVILASVIRDGPENRVHLNSATLAAVNMVNVKMVLAYAFLGGMVDIVRWKDVQLDVVVTDHAESIPTDFGNADALTAGMERIVQLSKNRIAMMLKTMIKVHFYNI